MLIPYAVYRFNRIDKLVYYQAARTAAGVDYLSPINLDGSDLVSHDSSGRTYLILYFVTKEGTLAAGGYWLDTEEPFDHVYLTDATVADLDLVVEDLAALPTVDRRLDDVLHRHEIQLDMAVWGSLLQ